MVDAPDVLIPEGTSMHVFGVDLSGPAAASRGVHGAQLGDVTGFSKNPGARSRLLAWLAGQGLTGIEMRAGCTSHFVAACGAALAAWKWHLDTWIARAEPPWHPYDFAC